MQDFTKIGDYDDFNAWYKKYYLSLPLLAKHKHDIKDIIYAKGNVFIEDSSGMEDEFESMYIFFRPYFFEYNRGEDYWVIVNNDGDITTFYIDAYMGMWEQNTPVDTTGMSQDLSKILDDWEKHDSAPGGSGNNWIFNPGSTQRWKDIVLERDEQCRSFWGDDKIRDMMLSLSLIHI